MQDEDEEGKELLLGGAKPFGFLSDKLRVFGFLLLLEDALFMM